jgi:hypothetical protein
MLRPTLDHEYNLFQKLTILGSFTLYFQKIGIVFKILFPLLNALPCCYFIHIGQLYLEFLLIHLKL